MKILCIGQVENDKHIRKEIAKQTVQPDEIYLYVDENPAEGINARRAKIAENHHKLREYVEKSDCDFIWQVEGDCVFEEDTLDMLIFTYQSAVLFGEQKIGYVSGVQVGRHGIYALGAWHFNEDRTEFWSLNPKLELPTEVDATGFYSLLATKDVWLQGECTWQGEAWGCDVNFGLSLRDKGYTIIANPQIPIGHIIERKGLKRGTINPSDNNIETVRFKLNNNKWEYKTE